MRKEIIISLLVLGAMASKSQTLVIDGEIRPRTEYRDGYKAPISTTNDPGIFTSQRTRLGITFTSGLLTTQITLQDSRIFGQQASTSSAATTGLFEAWANMLLMPGGSLIIGRQAIKYDDNRIFSASAWSNTGSTHDLVLFKYGINDFKADLGLAYNNNSETSVETFYIPGSKYRSMGYLWLSTATYNGFTLTGIVVAEGLQDTLGLGGIDKYKMIDMNQAFTYGGNLKYENADFPLSGLATAYFQSGKNYSNKTLEGKLLALKLNYNITNHTSVGLGTDYLSGDKNGIADGIQSNFRKLYGTDHAFNGFIDYWNTPLTQGLLDYYGSVIGKIGKNLTLEGDYHIFNTEFSGKNAKHIVFDKNLGSEFDFLITYKLNSWTMVQGGYCRYFLNNNTLIAKDLVTVANTYPTLRTPQWAYVMFTIKPTFLNTILSEK
ncbi:MAG: alginate export family protein [Paludibacter sp.]|nr:alginate export family protein [Paludibacter sp.]